MHQRELLVPTENGRSMSMSGPRRMPPSGMGDWSNLFPSANPTLVSDRKVSILVKDKSDA